MNLLLKCLSSVLGGLCLAMPLCAQKNLLPAAKAAFGKNAPGAALAPQSVGTALARTFGQTTVAAQVRRAPGRAVSGQAAQPPVLNAAHNTAAQAASFRLQLPAVRPLAVTDKQLAASVEKSVLKQLKKHSRKQSQKFAKAQAAVLRKINDTWLKNEEFLHSEVLNIASEPFKELSWFAWKNNQLVLSGGTHFFEKAKWLRKRPGQGQDALKSIPYGGEAINQLAKDLAKNNLVFLGEIHFMAPVQQGVAQLLYALREQNPGRRIVLFTEFVDIPGTEIKNTRGDTFFSYYRRPEETPSAPLELEEAQSAGRLDYATEMFQYLLEDNFEVYPLEDRTLWRLMKKEEPTLHFSEVSALALVSRNKSWARTMETKMAEIRKTAPDALFVVYAGIAHTSWIMPQSLPKFFANELSTVVEITASYPSGLNTLDVVWSLEHPFFNTKGLSFWSGPDARLLGRQTGFDYALVVPE